VTGLELDGSEAQRRRWLPELASGRIIGAFALTEAEAGLADNQGLQWQLADMAADLHGARLVAHDAAVRYDREPDHRPEACAMAKLVAAEMAFRVADRTLQLFGGAGYSKDLPVERIWRDIRVVRILDGASEILRTIVARHVQAAMSPPEAKPVS
jgi:alkylation response protein AidB-like acyl-CoA dehydrogenase